MRVASLLPSATEIVCIVGAQEDLVGRSHECNYPLGLDALPVLTRPRVSLPKESSEIDKAVRSALVDAASVYEILEDRLASAAPEVIVTQDLCEVCAVGIDDVRKAIASLASGAELVSLTPKRLADVFDDILRVGEALGRSATAQTAVGALRTRLDTLAARTAQLDKRPTVLTVEWTEPVMVGGLWMPELADIAGGRALAVNVGEPAPTLSFEQLAELDPDVVLVKPCGFDLPRTRQELAVLRRTLPWTQWKACREGRVFLTDGDAFFNRPGPRLVESAEILAACLHPEACSDLAERHANAMELVAA